MTTNTIKSNAGTITSNSYSVNVDTGTVTVGYSNSYKIPLCPSFEEQIKELVEKYSTDQEETEKVIPRPKDKIKTVFINSKLGVTTVLWADGTKTCVKCQEGDTYDIEKGIAMCFMKKAYDNRGCFNEFLKKWSENAVEQGKDKKKQDKPAFKAKRPKLKKLKG